MKSLLLKPILVLPLFVLFSRAMEEYYPISHYPMYATIDTKPVWYIYLGDADNLTDAGFPDPIPAEYIVGLRPDKAKKDFQNDLKKHAAHKLGLNEDGYYDMPHPEWTEVGEEALKKFRELASGERMKNKQVEKRVTPPARFALIFVEITMEPGTIPTESRRVIALEKTPESE